jgi:hypothetical protein
MGILDKFPSQERFLIFEDNCIQMRIELRRRYLLIDIHSSEAPNQEKNPTHAGTITSNLHRYTE